MRASVSSTREPMKPESRPSSEQGLASAVNLAGAFDHEFTQTPLYDMETYGRDTRSWVVVQAVELLCRLVFYESQLLVFI